ncbi:MAG: hypothetical protein KGS61_17665, partial [Verrucomicrobia bacterium]|nr:hypothetical protein [Verrucomicrobiota bacterium]
MIPAIHLAEPSKVPKPRFRIMIVAVGIAVVAIVWAFREPLRRQITERGILANDAPQASIVEELVGEAVNPQAVILKLWDTAKIVHRELALHELSRIRTGGRSLPPKLKTLLLSATLDADLDVREQALSYLSGNSDPALPAMALAQLKDCDPQVRLLGLRYLKGVPASIGIPAVVPLLDDDDPEIVAMVVSLLSRWSGVNFG